MGGCHYIGIFRIFIKRTEPSKTSSNSCLGVSNERAKTLIPE